MKFKVGDLVYADVGWRYARELCEILSIDEETQTALLERVGRTDRYRRTLKELQPA